MERSTSVASRNTALLRCWFQTPSAPLVVRARETTRGCAGAIRAAPGRGGRCRARVRLTHVDDPAGRTLLRVCELHRVDVHRGHGTVPRQGDRRASRRGNTEDAAPRCKCRALDRRIFVHTAEQQPLRVTPGVEPSGFPGRRARHPGVECCPACAATTQARTRNAKFLTIMPAGSGIIRRAHTKPPEFIDTSSPVCATAATTGRHPLSTQIASPHSTTPSARSAQTAVRGRTAEPLRPHRFAAARRPAACTRTPRTTRPRRPRACVKRRGGIGRRGITTRTCCELMSAHDVARCPISSYAIRRANSSERGGSMNPDTHVDPRGRPLQPTQEEIDAWAAREHQRRAGVARRAESRGEARVGRALSVAQRAGSRGVASWARAAGRRPLGRAGTSAAGGLGGRADGGGEGTVGASASGSSATAVIRSPPAPTDTDVESLGSSREAAPAGVDRRSVGRGETPMGGATGEGLLG